MNEQEYLNLLLSENLSDRILGLGLPYKGNNKKIIQIINWYKYIRKAYGEELISMVYHDLHLPQLDEYILPDGLKVSYLNITNAKIKRLPIKLQVHQLNMKNSNISEIPIGIKLFDPSPVEKHRNYQIYSDNYLNIGNTPLVEKFSRNQLSQNIRKLGGNVEFENIRGYE